MSRTLSDPQLGLISDHILPIKFGGTSGSTSKKARENLGMVGTDMLDQPNGVVRSDSNSLVPLTLLLDYADSVPTVDGPTDVQGSVEALYTITNYDYQLIYNLVLVGEGSVERTGEIITYTPPSVASSGGDGFILNGKKYLFSVSQNGVNKPSITAPIDNSENVATTYTFESSVFAYYGTSQSHTSSDWEISTDPTFIQAPAFSITNSIANKTSWSVSGLTADTQYYIRVRYKGSGTGYSPWSTVSSFTTKALYPSVEMAALLSNESDTGANHGYSTAISSDGTIAVIGAPGIDGVGAAFVFTKINDVWTQTIKLTPTDSPEYTHTKTGFGTSVAINTLGTTILVGSPTDGNNSQIESGSVYVYTKSGNSWVRQTILHGDNWAGATTEKFGFSVAIYSTGDLAIIGAPTGDSGKGYVYVYSRSGSTWTQSQKLQPTVLTGISEFGYSVGLSGNQTYIVVGARNIAAYVFKYASSTWSQQAKLNYDTLPENFGISVAIDNTGSTVLVGADYATITLSEQGTVYVFTRSVNTWTKQTKLLSINPTQSEHFGFSVAINAVGDMAIVGAPKYGSSINTFEKGCSYTFTKSSNVWNQKKQMIPLNASSFGSGSFTKLNQKPSAGYWRSMTAFRTNVYAGTSTGRIYVQTNGIGNFVLLSQQMGKSCTGMCATETDVYLCLNSGDIYKQTNGTGDFVALGQTSRSWTGMAAIGNDIYACVTGGKIYKQTNGVGNFEIIEPTSRQWNSICADGDTLYATVNNGGIYRKLASESVFTQYFVAQALWVGITASEGDVYAVAQSADLYVKKSTANTFTATTLWTSSMPTPYSLATLGCNLYLGADVTNGMYKLSSGASNYGYSVSLSSNASHALVGMPLTNASSGISVGQVRVLQ